MMIEMLIYIVIMTIMLSVIFGVIVVFVRSNNRIKESKNIENSAISALERITREIHDAKDVEMSQSSFGSNPGILVLNTTDTSGNPRLVRFSVDSGVLRLSENGVDNGPLTLGKVKITNLIFRFISTSNSKAVKIELTLEGNVGSETKTESFYDTAILRSR